MEAGSFSFSYLPKSFQKSTLEKISRVIKAGGSLQLVGIPGSGSSMIAKALTQIPEVKNSYFNSNYAFVLLNGNMLLERSSLNLTRLLLSSLTLNQKITKDEIRLQIEIEEKLDEICQNQDLTLIIDHASELEYPELKPFFTNLYSMYRKFEPKFHLIFIVTRTLTKQVDLENFGLTEKLITQNVVNIELLNKQDSTWFMKEEEKLGIKLKNNELKKIHMLSGGFPRTIKRLVESLRQGYKLENIEKDPNIYLPLSLHLEELSKFESVSNKVPILKQYIALKGEKYNTEKIQGISFPARLTKMEEKILNLLLSKKGNILKREEGIEAVWGSNGLEVSDHAYDQIVHRLRNKLKRAQPKVILETIKSRGHALKVEK